MLLGDSYCPLLRQQPVATQQEGRHICKQNKPAQHDDHCNTRANQRAVSGSHPLEPVYERLVSIAHNRDDKAKEQPLTDKQPHDVRHDNDKQ